MTASDSTELREVADLAGRGAAAVAAVVRDTHLAIARRAFGLGGRAAKPVRVVSEAGALGVYTAVGAGLRLAGLVSGLVAAGRVADAPVRQALADRPGSDLVVGALNGAWGDLLADRRSPLALPMSLRHEQADLPIERTALARAYPAASGELAVFVHGLCETERSWQRSALDQHGEPGSSHGSRLQRDCGLTPVYVRYNSGRRICDNGEALGELLTRLIGEWPVPVSRLTLIGHSMGGLVIRAACHSGVERSEPWVPLVRRIGYLGSPHLGAPLEQSAAALVTTLSRLPETRALAGAIGSRSAGIRDLCHGDVRAVTLDAGRGEAADLALLPSAEHLFLGVTVGRRPDTVAARVIGDAMVPYSSAAGRRRPVPDFCREKHLGGLHHLDLLNHPRVYAVLREWLSDEPAAGSPTGRASAPRVGDSRNGAPRVGDPRNGDAR